MNFVKRISISLAIFGVAALAVYFIPALRDPIEAANFDVNGWQGWLAFFVSVVGLSIVGTYLKGFVLGFAPGLKTGTGATAVAFISEIAGWLLVGVAIAIIAALLPTVVVITNPIGGWLLLLVLGVASAVDDYVQVRLGFKKQGD